jgi:IS30 family transposase
MMNRHQPAQHRAVLHVREAARSEEAHHGSSAAAPGAISARASSISRRLHLPSWPYDSTTVTKSKRSTIVVKSDRT